MTKGLPDNITFFSPRVHGTYQGCQVIHHQDKVEMRLMVEVNTGKKRETQPLVMVFSPSAYADLQFELYRFSEGNGQPAYGMWDRQLKEQDARNRRRERRRKA